MTTLDQLGLVPERSEGVKFCLAVSGRKPSSVLVTMRMALSVPLTMWNRSITCSELWNRVGKQRVDQANLVSWHRSISPLRHKTADKGEKTFWTTIQLCRSISNISWQHCSRLSSNSAKSFQQLNSSGPMN